jgi:hypothetical protein
MKSMVFISILLALSSSQAVASDITPSIELLGCDKGSACVSMLLDVPNDSVQDVIISPKDKDVEATEDSQGDTTFHVRFEGRLKGKTETIDATFKGYTEGIHCTAFGQGTVGLLGYSASGNPIINSSAGPIEIVDSRIDVGCDHCLIVEDSKTGKTVATFHSPGYDLSITGYRAEEFSFDLPGGYNVKAGEMCLRVQDKGPVQSVYPERCSPPSKTKIKFEGEACS